MLVSPIAAQIGAALDPPHSTLLIMATALICSAGMGLPVSGFPNLMAVNLEDEVGHRYLTVNDFLKAGVRIISNAPRVTTNCRVFSADPRFDYSYICHHHPWLPPYALDWIVTSQHRPIPLHQLQPLLGMAGAAMPALAYYLRSARVTPLIQTRLVLWTA